MERVKRIFWLIHLVVWGLFILLVCLQLSNEKDAHWVSTFKGFIASCLYVFYGHFYLLTQHTGQRWTKSYWAKLGALALTGPLPILLFNHKPFDFGYYLMHLITVAVFLFLSWLARITEDLVLNTIRKEQLEKQVMEAELHNLKSQINPHFLFNTLNNIHTLVYKQAPAAPEAVTQLASLMRYMMYESNAATVPLAREIAYLQDYISLQQLRYKSNPVVDLHLEGEPESCYIAPLLFVHLLENAYKHSPARLEPGDMKVNLTVNDNELSFSVQNPIGKKATTLLDEPGGIGLPNVRKRLSLLYPEQHTLAIQNTGETFTITLHIRGFHLPAHERKAHLLHH